MLATLFAAHTVPLFTAVIAAGVFACAAYFGIELSKIVLKASPLLVGVVEERREGKDAGPVPLACASAACGAILALRGLLWQDLAMATVICVCLVACLHEAVSTGKMSDYFILIPLSSIVVALIAQRNWLALCGPVIPFLPFALTAYTSKGKKMGWDDAKLAALGGAVLGVRLALLAFATACIAAAVVARFQSKTKEPILFAPYMIASIALCALLTIERAN
jgi:prepilin signal peptidase PulO-like enzyme (type II secretory pathway)